VLERLKALGYGAEVGVEIESHLLRPDGTPLSDGVQAYSLQKLSELDLLAAVVAGIENREDPGARGEGNLYGEGQALPATLADGVTAAPADARIVEILGEDAVHDFTALAQAEWQTFVGTVSDWDRDRYLRSV
jgi:hypothetical protein